MSMAMHADDFRALPMRHTGLSDLFFNHTLDHRNALMAEHDGDSWPSVSEEFDAVKADAECFLRLYGPIILGAEDVTPDELASDFMQRA